MRDLIPILSILISIIIRNKGALKLYKILEIKSLVIDLFLNSDTFYNCILHFSSGNVVVVGFFFFDCTKFGIFD